MAGYSARQSSFTTGDTILAAHSNDEFNQVLAAFHATTGHSHDGTAGEGGPVTTLRDADSLNKILEKCKSDNQKVICFFSSSDDEYELIDGHLNRFKSWVDQKTAIKEIITQIWLNK